VCVCVYVYLFREAAGLIVGSRFLDAAPELRAVSVELPGRLGEDLAVSRSGILEGKYTNNIRFNSNGPAGERLLDSL